LSDEDQVNSAPARAALYIDGFNLYHAIADLDVPLIKWASYWHLGESIIKRRSETLVKVVYCTAHTKNQDKKWRHQQFVKAQEIHGVEVALGHFAGDRRKCNECNNEWWHPTEKAGDINVAIHLMRDGFLDQVDHAYLLTADSDQAATAKMFASQFPNKKLTSVSPPGREPSTHILSHCEQRKIKLNRDHFERCVMPEIVMKEGVKGNARRPREYAPYEGWVHPNNRPKS
jgi:uncharacterized LabA/DUF88 family protein